MSIHQRTVAIAVITFVVGFILGAWWFGSAPYTTTRVGEYLYHLNRRTGETWVIYEDYAQPVRFREKD